jgi:hypothetical protein
MKNIKIIVEFSDSLIEAKDLLNFDIIVDENQDRKKLAATQELRNRVLTSESKLEGHWV